MPEQLKPEHPYTEAFMHVAEDVAQGKHPIIGEQMNAAFEKSSQFEMSMWDNFSDEVNIQDSRLDPRSIKFT